MNKEKSVYVQPGCKVYQVSVQSVIASSDTEAQAGVSNPFGDNYELVYD